jgi:hypothetical protein
MRKIRFSIVTTIAMAWLSIGSANAAEAAPAGRYQIVKMNDYTAFLLDSDTGKCWSWTSIPDDADPNGVPLAHVFAPCRVFDASEDVSKFAAEMQGRVDAYRNAKARVAAEEAQAKKAAADAKKNKGGGPNCDPSGCH